MGQSDQHLEIPTWATGSPGRSDRRMRLHEHPQFANHLLDEPKTFIEGWAKAASAAGPPRNLRDDGGPALAGASFGHPTKQNSPFLAAAKLQRSPPS